jgi:hypothetical protein
MTESVVTKRKPSGSKGIQFVMENNITIPWKRKDSAT